ncbi:Uncharacterised protein [Burkholderia multivorans]|nr:Uncharacterised protein [Burkholderia multivorans]
MRAIGAAPAPALARRPRAACGCNAATARRGAERRRRLTRARRCAPRQRTRRDAGHRAQTRVRRGCAPHYAGAPPAERRGDARLNRARRAAAAVRRMSHAARVLRRNVIRRNGCATRASNSPSYGTGADHALRRSPGPACGPRARCARRPFAAAGRFDAPRFVMAALARALPARPRVVDRPARADRGRAARGARQGRSVFARVGPVPDAAARDDPRRRLLRDADRRARRDDRLSDRSRASQRLPPCGAAHRLVLVGERGRHVRRRERADRSRADHRAQDRPFSRRVHDAHLQRGADLFAGRRADRRARRVGRAVARQSRQPASRLSARAAERGADRGRLFRAQHGAALDPVRAS